MIFKIKIKPSSEFFLEKIFSDPPPHSKRVLTVNSATFSVYRKDTEAVLKKAASKILAARVFNDDNEKMNLNIQQVQGSILAISQFTLSWRGDKGNRPSFDLSMPPNEAEQLFNHFCELLREHVPVEKGRFGASSTKA